MYIYMINTYMCNNNIFECALFGRLAKISLHNNFAIYSMHYSPSVCTSMFLMHILLLYYTQNFSSTV